MLTKAPKPTAEQLARIDKLDAEAKDALRRKEESFQRCDTDGFLSQWANGMTNDLNRREIQILKNGGHAQFPVLCDADGNVVASKVYVFPNPGGAWLPPNRRWRLPNELADKLDRKWVPCGDKSRIQKQLDLHEEHRWFPAYAKITTPAGAKSTGLGGCANAYVGVFRADTNSED